MSQLTAQSVFRAFQDLPSSERARFYELLGEIGARDENFSHEEVFGHLSTSELTAAEAAAYLDISMSSFRRYVTSGKLKATKAIGRNFLFSAQELKQFKRSRRQIKD
jgi:excisionase family DNA binding protein